MSEPKPLASLSSSLLARKGGAKPAMRRQGLSSFPDHSTDAFGDSHEDLGWNDMGYDVDPDHDQHPIEHLHHNPLAGAIPNPGAAVRQQQEEIAAKLSAQPAAKAIPQPAENDTGNISVPMPVSAESRPLAPRSTPSAANKTAARRVEKPRSATKSRTRKAKTAFTLRLDPERHLKLRLATAVQNVSAQQLVTKAVDEYLKSIPELDDLAKRVPSRGAA